VQGGGSNACDNPVFILFNRDVFIALLLAICNMCVRHNAAVRLAHKIVHLTGRKSFHRRSTIVPKTAENRSKIVPQTGVYAIVVERFCIWHYPLLSQER
jgi:hypothetical protein